MHFHHAESKPEVLTLAHAAVGLALACLVLLGFMGTVYKLIAADGWIAAAFERSATAGGAAIGSCFLLATCVWYVLVSARRHRLVAESVGYVFAAVGGLYLMRYLLEGSF